MIWRCILSRAAVGACSLACKTIPSPGVTSRLDIPAPGQERLSWWDEALKNIFAQISETAANDLFNILPRQTQKLYFAIGPTVMQQSTCTHYGHMCGHLNKAFLSGWHTRKLGHLRPFSRERNQSMTLKIRYYAISNLKLLMVWFSNRDTQ